MTTPNSRSRIPDATIALVSELAERGQRAGRPIDATETQRLVFVAQESLGLPTGYSFEFSPQGPLSSDLAADIELAGSVGAISIRFSELAEGRFMLLPASNAPKYKARASDFIQRAESLLEKLGSDFLFIGADQMELKALIIFSAREFSSDDQVALDSVKSIVRELRPRLSEESIVNAMDELRSKGYLHSEKIGA